MLLAINSYVLAKTSKKEKGISFEKSRQNSFAEKRVLSKKQGSSLNGLKEALARK